MGKKVGAWPRSIRQHASPAHQPLLPDQASVRPRTLWTKPCASTSFNGYKNTLTLHIASAEASDDHIPLAILYKEDCLRCAATDSLENKKGNVHVALNLSRDKQFGRVHALFRKIEALIGARSSNRLIATSQLHWPDCHSSIPPHQV